MSNAAERAAPVIALIKGHIALMRTQLTVLEAVRDTIGGEELLKALDITWIAAHQLSLELAMDEAEEPQSQHEASR